MARSVTLRLGGDFAGRWIRWDLAKLRRIRAGQSKTPEEAHRTLADAVIDTNLVDSSGKRFDLRRVATWEDLTGDVQLEIIKSMRGGS